MSKKAKFTKSKVACLFRHRAGLYYAIAKVRGKIVRRSLETADFNLAKEKLPGVLKELRGASLAATAGTLREAIIEEAARADPALKETTRHYYQQVATALSKFSEGLAGDPLARPLPKATLPELRRLMDAFRPATSATRYNGALALLRRTFERAIEALQIGANPAADLDRVKALPRKLELPTADTVAALVASIRAQRKSHSESAAAAVELLAYSGLRISEAQALTWEDVRERFLIVRTAKNDDFRQVPLIPAMTGLLDRLRGSGLPCRAGDPVMPITSPRLALEAACKRLGLGHLRIHDLRHIFATRCIEAGVDLPTLARWLGHKDGGVLAAKTYGHLTENHSVSMAEKVRA